MVTSDQKIWKATGKRQTAWPVANVMPKSLILPLVAIVTSRPRGCLESSLHPVGQSDSASRAANHQVYGCAALGDADGHFGDVDGDQ